MGRVSVHRCPKSRFLQVGETRNVMAVAKISFISNATSQKKLKFEMPSHKLCFKIHKSVFYILFFNIFWHPVRRRHYNVKLILKELVLQNSGKSNFFQR